MILLGKQLGYFKDPYIVAEISGNHGGDINRAIKLIDAAKEAGADAVKIQCYTPDSLTLNNGYVIGGGTPWKDETLYELYQKAHTPIQMVESLFAYARSIRMPIFSSVYDEKGIEILERNGCMAYKIASYEANDPAFIEKVCAIGKPVIISTGTLNEAETQRMLIAATKAWKEDRLAILHCVSAYPTEIEDLNLQTMQEMMREFSFPVGFSCHSDEPMAMAIASALGATIIEVHLALDTKEYQADYEFSMLPDQLGYAIEMAKAARKSTWIRPGVEDAAKEFKRSLFVVKDIYAGETFTAEHIKSFRPNLGCEPHLLPNIIGRKAVRTIRANEPMKMEYVE